jgi:hypothetical protein
MNSLLAFIVLASIPNNSLIQAPKAVEQTVVQPAIVEAPKPPDRLTLYNAQGEVVARCGKTDDSFSNCKMEPGFTLDDLMNAWMHAYQEMEK